MYSYSNQEYLYELQLLLNIIWGSFLLAANEAQIHDMHDTLGLPTLQNRRDLHDSPAIKQFILNNFPISSFYVSVRSVTGINTTHANIGT